jgi:hypothetical protein
MRPDLTAALLWDRMTLLSSGEHGAVEFVDAMSLRRRPEGPAADDALGRAARGIWAEVSGESEEAHAAYEALSRSNDRDERLFGLLLLAWSEVDLDPIRIAETREEIERLDDPELKARLTMKLAYAAFEYKWDELLPTLFELAKGWAPDGSLLAQAIDRERYNLFGGDFPLGGGSADPLTEQRAITGLLGEAAQDALRMDVESAARAPWLLSFSIGADGGREVYAAEMQARWAGAIWLRSEVQTQLAVYLLRGGADSPGEYASAVALWALGRGQQIPQIVDLAEPHFDGGSADFVIGSLMRGGSVTARFDPRLIEAGIECWDLISEGTAIALLDRIEPVATDHPILRRNAVLFSLLGLRAPEKWVEQLERLSDDQLRAVTSGMSPAVAERITLRGAERLYEAVLSAEEIEADALPTVATLMGRLSEMEEFEPTDRLPARVVVRLAWSENKMLGEAELGLVIDELTQDVLREVDEARTGSASMGAVSTTNTLASAVVKLGEIPQRTLDLILSIAADASLPRNMRYDSIKFLAAITHDGLFDPKTRPGLLEKIPEAGSEAFWGSYPPALIRAAKLEFAMAAGLIDEYLPALLVLSRDSDPRVRIDASEAAGLGRAVTNHPLLESILLGGLFDPSGKVVQRAIFGFTELPPRIDATRAAFAERLRELFNRGDREVRAAIARLVSEAELPHDLRQLGVELARRAVDDRSYEVRMALTREPVEPEQGEG